MRFWETWSLVYVLEGSGVYHNEDHRTCVLRPGCLIIMAPGHGYRYEIESEQPWSEIFISFDGPAFDLWRVQGILSTDDPVWQLDAVEYWAGCLRHLLRALEGDGLARVCELQSFLATAHARHLGLQKADDDTRWLAQARELLDGEAFRMAPDWNRVARIMHVSFDRFRKKFRLLCGQTPYAWITDIRLRRACELLRQPNLPLKTIAQRCIFCDEFHFSKRFRQTMGLSPSQYRALSAI